MPDESTALVITTSSANWLRSLANAYKSKTWVHLIDDTNIGINPINETLLAMGTDMIHLDFGAMRLRPNKRLAADASRLAIWNEAESIPLGPCP